MLLLGMWTQDLVLSTFSMTLLLGVVGNAMILWAVLGFREMKSPTNIFLASLALADLLLCSICLPVKVSTLAKVSTLVNGSVTRKALAIIRFT
jgi:hypothetical protein